MSRTNHPSKYNFDSHPYWRFQWWGSHGPAVIRRQYNRRDRRRNKLRVRAGKDPIPFRRYLPWIWW